MRVFGGAVSLAVLNRVWRALADAEGWLGVVSRVLREDGSGDLVGDLA